MCACLGFTALKGFQGTASVRSPSPASTDIVSQSLCLAVTRMEACCYCCSFCWLGAQQAEHAHKPCSPGHCPRTQTRTHTSSHCPSQPVGRSGALRLRARYRSRAEAALVSLSGSSAGGSGCSAGCSCCGWPGCAAAAWPCCGLPAALVAAAAAAAAPPSSSGGFAAASCPCSFFAL